MPCISYIPRSFQGSTKVIIDRANQLLEEYSQQGLVLTLRQLYYQFVAQDLFPDSWAHPVSKTKNHFRNYKKLQAIVNDARLAGLMDWDHLEDRTRNLMSYPHQDSPANALALCGYGYRENLWRDQSHYVEVWVEKDALIGIVEQATQVHRVPYFSCRGYTSQSELWRAALRLESRCPEDGNVVVIHLGDHDPSGVDMTRDIQERMDLFAPGANIEVRRIALTMTQVKKYNPPPNPAKETDSRCGEYRAKYGSKSWELDALEPKVLTKLIQTEVAKCIDDAAWQAALEHEAKARNQLVSLSQHYDKVIPYVERLARK